MTYNQFIPHPELANHIDAFWTAKGNGEELVTEKILPDGCVDLIFNLGDDCKTDNDTFTMQNGKVYLVGTMTNFKETGMNSETNLFGIRFKPAAFTAFYKFSSLNELNNQTIEFEKALSPDIQKTIDHSTEYLNQFFLNRLTIPKHNLFSIIADIHYHKGQINVQQLTKRHFITTRQLERNFKAHSGISPKDFIKLVRFRYTLLVIQKRTPEQSLSDIAFQCGYYDHAHLTSELKRYTGVLPSQL